MSATVSARPAPGRTIADGIEAMDRVSQEVLGPQFATTLSGQSRDFQETSNQLLYVFGLAILLIYLVLAAQFESFRDPFTILCTVPLAMLIGLVAKNGILIVEFANQRKAAGLSIREAIEDAAAARFRPILMTALSTTLGVLPIALAFGSAAQSRVPMGLAVVGGLVVGTLFALYVIPAIYSYVTSETAGPVSLGGDGAMEGDGVPEGEVAAPPSQTPETSA
jgi:multidrug efflux pump